MRVIASEFMALDGVVQAPGGPEEDTSGGFRHGGWSWQYFDPNVMGPVIGEFAERCEALLQGRRTYQVSAAAWPERSGDPFADWINRAQKYVVSDTLNDGGSHVEPDAPLSAAPTWSSRCRHCAASGRRHLRLWQPVARASAAHGRIAGRAACS